MESRCAMGRSSPLGATFLGSGVNFSLFSRHATRVELLLFDGAEEAHPARTLEIDPVSCRSYHYWSAFVPGIGPGQHYGFRVHGPDDPARGMRFDPRKVLLDPYARAIAVPPGYSRAAACAPGDNAASAMKGVVIDRRAYDWEGDRPLRRPASRTVVYELHVRGFTRHPSSGVDERRRGTYAGLVEKIPYLLDLGVTAVELMPVFQFDAQDAPPGRVNYWGYSPVGFFAPHVAYSAAGTPLGALDEFRDMVKALHRAGIEVILDVVYNHTAEGGAGGPMLSLRGIDAPTYYMMDDAGRDLNFSGTGNTLNGNHPIARRMILDSLRSWVEEMHVDGFRFDLASVLSRDRAGVPMIDPPLLWDIESDPVLAGSKLIAEAWDAAGLYQVGNFLGDSWREWNGRFRDDVRDFVRGEPGRVRSLAARVLGSPDLFGHEQREAEQSVNFVACHDGFTLADLVSYDRKHNEANGEENRDGESHNRSWNCGVEGPTDDPQVLALRARQARNLLALTMLSLGMPMIAMGDEMGRTQGGNNNAYCHDDASNWLDWGLLGRDATLHRFVKLLVQRRLLRDVEHERRRTSLNELLAGACHAWHGVRVGQPDWSDDSRSLAFSVELAGEEVGFYMAMNAYWEPLEFELPPPCAHADAGAPRIWRRWIDTFLPPPQEIVPWDEAPAVESGRYRVGPRSVVVLVATAQKSRSSSI